MIYLTGLALRLHPGVLYPTCIHCAFQEADPDEVRSARDLSIYLGKKKGEGNRHRQENPSGNSKSLTPVQGERQEGGSDRQNLRLQSNSGKSRLA